MTVSSISSSSFSDSSMHSIPFWSVDVNCQCDVNFGQNNMSFCISHQILRAQIHHWAHSYFWLINGDNWCFQIHFLHIDINSWCDRNISFHIVLLCLGLKLRIHSKVKIGIGHCGCWFLLSIENVWDFLLLSHWCVLIIAYSNTLVACYLCDLLFIQIVVIHSSGYCWMETVIGVTSFKSSSITQLSYDLAQSSETQWLTTIPRTSTSRLCKWLQV